VHPPRPWNDLHVLFFISSHLRYFLKNKHGSLVEEDYPMFQMNGFQYFGSSMSSDSLHFCPTTSIKGIYLQQQLLWTMLALTTYPWLSVAFLW
jgi:hypothetical protein